MRRYLPLLLATLAVGCSPVVMQAGISETEVTVVGQGHRFRLPLHRPALPLQTGSMFGGQLLTAVLPWFFHGVLAVLLAPRLVGAVVTVSGLSLLLGLTGAALGLLNRYAVSLEFERSTV